MHMLIQSRSWQVLGHAADPALMARFDFAGGWTPRAWVCISSLCATMADIGAEFDCVGVLLWAGEVLQSE
jgi:hypothetical protein